MPRARPMKGRRRGDRQRPTGIESQSQGTPIRLEQGVLLATYARYAPMRARKKVSRVRQIVDWLGFCHHTAIVPA